ncbi:hypothetical protein J8N05_46620 (plasmid) [Streptomyces sp. BH-SS-21]|uniref:Uncharacterized protein n=1 Tax=Streptomyces liliiviolaceus TaxID=2823109 RepID=A0A940Y4V1_9ACTN|nr:hypothetical protein [Streptomyces liliiviolaceus]MBQ0855638.1 hypothetical protein [Streptomyces liliiviolaceus]
MPDDHRPGHDRGHRRRDHRPADGSALATARQARVLVLAQLAAVDGTRFARYGYAVLGQASDRGPGQCVAPVVPAPRRLQDDPVHGQEITDRTGEHGFEGRIPSAAGGVQGSLADPGDVPDAGVHRRAGNRRWRERPTAPPRAASRARPSRSR